MTPVSNVSASAYEIPTDAPEADGTLTWDSTTLVVVEAHAAGRTGVGYTYAGPAAATVVNHKLAPTVLGKDAQAPPARWADMQRVVRNLGKPGIAVEAVSAVDIALWDLHCRLLDVPMVSALGAVHTDVPIYGSGGFTSYDEETLVRQLHDWVTAGIGRVKMKVGRAWEDDLRRVRAVRDAIGPAGMTIAAGEYGYHLPYFHQMLQAAAVDCLQADVTRCLGISGRLRVPH